MNKSAKKNLLSCMLVVAVLFSSTGCQKGEPIESETTKQVIDTALASVTSPSSMQVDGVMDISITDGEKEKSHLVMKANTVYQNEPWIQQMTTQYFMNDEEMETLASQIYISQEENQAYYYMKAASMKGWEKNEITQEQKAAYEKADNSTLDVSLFYEYEDDFRLLDEETTEGITYMVLEGELSGDVMQEVGAGLKNLPLFFDIEDEMMNIVIKSVDELPVTLKINKKDKTLSYVSLDITQFVQNLMDNVNDSLKDKEKLLAGDCDSATMSMTYKNINSAPTITLPQM